MMSNKLVNISISGNLANQMSKDNPRAADLTLQGGPPPAGGLRPQYPSLLSSPVAMSSPLPLPMQSPTSATLAPGVNGVPLNLGRELVGPKTIVPVDAHSTSGLSKPRQHDKFRTCFLNSSCLRWSQPCGAHIVIPCRGRPIGLANPSHGTNSSLRNCPAGQPKRVKED